MLDPARNMVCVQLEDAGLGEAVREALAGGLFSVSDALPPDGGKVAIVVADAAHSGVLDDLADGFLLGNSVRGLHPARLLR